MSQGRIFYLIPDVFHVPFLRYQLREELEDGKALTYLKRVLLGHHRPIGGIKVHYQHCRLLRDAGFDASPLLLGRRSGDFFNYELQKLKLKDVGTILESDDVVVATEYEPYDGLQFEGCTRVLFVQNWINIDRRLKPEDRGKSYLDLGYDHVICCSDYNASEVQRQMNIESTVLANALDHEIFHPRPEERIQGRVLCLPRKQKSDLREIQRLVRMKLPEVDFHEVDGVSEAEMAAEYRKADVLLATGYPEGFSLPPLEAMASGCAVAGFTGGAGQEFMRDGETALVAPDGDCQAAANALIRLLEKTELRETLRTNGLRRAQNYSLPQLQDSLSDFFSKIQPTAKRRRSSHPGPISVTEISSDHVA